MYIIYIYIYKCCILERVVCFFSFSGREIFELDNYSPIPVENETEYKLVVSRFPFHDAEIEKVCSAFSDGHSQIYTQSVANDQTQNLNSCAPQRGSCHHRAVFCAFTP